MIITNDLWKKEEKIKRGKKETAMTKNRIKKEVVTAPGNIDEAVDYVRLIGEAQRHIDKIATDLNDEVEKLKEKAAEKAKQFEDAVAGLFEGLYIFAETNRAKLTDNDKIRIIKVISGQFGWRTNPPSVEAKDVAKAIAELKTKGLAEYVRIKEELDKEAILKNQAVVNVLKEISIKQDEMFFVKPDEIEAELFRGKGGRKIKKK
jgi:phage host-nuclease inhibitor protein Gam